MLNKTHNKLLHSDSVQLSPFLQKQKTAKTTPTYSQVSKALGKNKFTSLKSTKEYKMLEQFVGKKVKIVVGPQGEETQYGLLKAVNDKLISLEGAQGSVRVINTASTNFFELSLQNQN